MDRYKITVDRIGDNGKPVRVEVYGITAEEARSRGDFESLSFGIRETILNDIHNRRIGGSQEAVAAKVRRAIERLGNLNTSIPVYLLQRGFKGPRTGTSCPVSLYLQAEVPEAEDVYVGSKSVRVDGEEITDIPAPVSKFIEDFDDLKYLNLYVGTARSDA